MSAAHAPDLPKVVADAVTPDALLDGLGRIVAAHASHFSIQLSCSVRHYPSLFCVVHVHDGHPLAVAACLGGQMRGVRGAVAFIEPSPDFRCAKRAGGAPAADCYDCRCQV